MLTGNIISAMHEAPAPQPALPLPPISWLEPPEERIWTADTAPYLGMEHYEGRLTARDMAYAMLHTDAADERLQGLVRRIDEAKTNHQHCGCKRCASECVICEARLGGR